ncbi:hypothetical protein KGF56_000705 [Candida oxycetoniae]|uniref:Uncharacterized protein n=1 Tax=Candida oxycetoniae TaxID=497107 RepID=A0AAI9T0J8_9ASCO|nr:uncharacterized protein KGF56_000705 [Candida oxycetoniae]KAI3406573.2 hypothetical protein KGF56_000705 [Candida oxycetoniae]
MNKDTLTPPPPAPPPAPPSGVNSFTFTHSKRKNEDFDGDYKKIKSLTTEDLMNSNPEWPQFIHPDGGLVKITPWGSIRQFVDPITNETMTKFEDCGFDDYSFRSQSVEKIYSTPNTPQSLYQQQPPPQQLNQQSQQKGNNSVSYVSRKSSFNNSNSGNITRMNLSPSAEVEGYVVDGYSSSPLKQKSPQQEQFCQEHENYFGMTELDCGYSNDEEDEVMS